MAITGIYIKDFPDLGRDAGSTDLIPIAEPGNILSYKTPVSGLINLARVVGALGYTPYGATPGTVGKLALFGATDLQDSLLSQSGNQINLGTYAAFGVNNPGTPGEPGVDNDAYIGSIINNDFLVKVNNTEALRIDTALRLKIANIQNATYDTDKFLVSDGGIVKYRTGAELLSDIGGASAGDLSGYVTLATAQTITGSKSFTANVSFGVGSPTAIESATGRIITDKFRLYNAIPATNYHDFASSASQNRTITVPDATGTMALTSDLGAYLPLTGGTLTSSGSANTLNINHTSGSGIALNILKNGNGEGLTIVKGSGSGNAASITGGITLLSELNLTTKLADAHIASAATWNAKIGGSGTTNYLAKFTASGVVGNSAVQEVSGNLGLGVTPSSWGTNFRAIQLVGGSLYTNAGGTTGQIGIGQNWYFDGSSNKYLNNAAASDYYQFAGEHRWFTAPSGTAGNAISFTQAMTLTANGNLLVGTDADTGQKLQVNGQARILDGNILTLMQVGNGNGSNIRSVTSGDFRVTTGGATDALIIANSGAATFSNTIKTGNPTGGTAQPFKVGSVYSTSSVFDGNVLQVEINGVSYDLMIADSAT
jgi:hypothetical protein